MLAGSLSPAWHSPSRAPSLELVPAGGFSRYVVHSQQFSLHEVAERKVAERKAAVCSSILLLAVDC